MKYCMSPRAKVIFHRIPQLSSQYSHSQLPLLVNIFLYWLRELGIFYRIANLRPLVWHTLSRREYCNSYFSIFHI